MWDIPKDKNYTADAVQCDHCGGHGCEDCEQKGWLTPSDHRDGRRCGHILCNKPLAPNHIAVYCSNECAFEDA